MTAAPGTPVRSDPEDRSDPHAAARSILGSLGSGDPYPAYARLRAVAPVYVPPEGPVLLTSYRAVAELLHTPGAGKDSDARFRQLGMPDWREHPGLRRMFDSILQLDEPEHGRRRAMVARVFTARRSEAMRPKVAAIVARLTDALRDSADTPVDLIAQWAFPLPVAVIGDLLGVPEQDRAPFADWVRDFTLALEPGIGPAELARCDAAAERLEQYFAELLRSRRRSPADDLTSALAAVDGCPDDELITMLILLFGAGFETTSHLLGNAVVALTRHPDQVARWRADPGLTANAVEELLRYDTPVQLNSRVLHAGTVLDGHPVPAGRIVFAFLGAANRDPEHAEQPDRLDLARPDPRPLSFGGGPHHCLGAALARIEAAEALPALLDAFDVEPAGTPEPREGFAVHGNARLPVRLVRRAG